MSRVAGVLLMVTLLGSSVYADVIPSQYPDKDAGQARQVVAARYQALGMSADQASGRVRGLPDDDARFFAANPDRVQMAGRLQEEQGSVFPAAAIIQGGVLLIAVAAVSFYQYSVHN
jgi:hypothetical protein